MYCVVLTQHACPPAALSHWPPTRGQAGWNTEPRVSLVSGQSVRADQREAGDNASMSCVGAIKERGDAERGHCSEAPQPRKRADHSLHLRALLQLGEVRVSAEGPALTSGIASFPPPEITTPSETSLNPPPGTCPRPLKARQPCRCPHLADGGSTQKCHQCATTTPFTTHQCSTPFHCTHPDSTGRRAQCVSQAVGLKARQANRVTSISLSELQRTEKCFNET